MRVVFIPAPADEARRLSAVDAVGLVFNRDTGAIGVVLSGGDALTLSVEVHPSRLENLEQLEWDVATAMSSSLVLLQHLERERYRPGVIDVVHDVRRLADRWKLSEGLILPTCGDNLLAILDGEEPEGA